VSETSQLVDLAAEGEEVILAREGEPVRERKPGRLQGRVWISDRFDDPLPEFESDDE